MIYRNVSEETIQTAVKNKWLRSLAFYVKSKQLFVNGQIYQYNSRKLGSLLNMSHTVVIRHIKKLRSLGLVRMSGDNLCFRNFQALAKKRCSHKNLIDIKENASLKEIETALHKSLLEMYARQQKYKIEQRMNATKVHDPKFKPTMKQIKIARETEAELKEKNKNGRVIAYDNVVMSDARVGRYLNMGKSGVTALKKRLKKMGVQINSTRFMLRRASFWEFKQLRAVSSIPSTTFWFNWAIWDSKPSSYGFPSCTLSSAL